MTSKRLNPWFEAGEWDYVKGLVLTRDIKALDFFQVIMLSLYFGIFCCNRVSLEISNQRLRGSVLVNDFWTPQAPPPINFVHDEIRLG